MSDSDDRKAGRPAIAAPRRPPLRRTATKTTDERIRVRRRLRTFRATGTDRRGGEAHGARPRVAKRMEDLSIARPRRRCRSGRCTPRRRHRGADSGTALLAVMVGAALKPTTADYRGAATSRTRTYGLTLCAERSPWSGAVGRRSVSPLASSPTRRPTLRAALRQCSGGIAGADIILGNLNGPTGRFRLSALLPLPFDSHLLG